MDRQIFFLNTLPKSASRYVFHTLREAYGATGQITAGGQFPNAALSRGIMQKMRHGRFITQEHIFPDTFNTLVLGEQLDRMLLHVRDPRQVMVSWVHHLAKQQTRGVEVPLRVLGVPSTFSAMSLPEQLDFVIANHLHFFIDWLRSWKETISEFPIPVLVTRFEDMVADPHAFFARIVAFYGIEPERPIVVDIPKPGEKHFRSGKIDEWRALLSAEQQEYVDTVIGDSLLSIYGWQRTIRCDCAPLTALSS